MVLAVEVAAVLARAVAAARELAAALVFARRADGPGSLHDFAGRPGGGQWTLTEVDNANAAVSSRFLISIGVRA